MLSTMRLVPIVWFLTLAFVVGSLWPAPVNADSWAMPKKERYESANGEFRITVTPAKIGSQLEYFRDRIAEEEGRKAPPSTTATASLERRSDDGGWTELWRGPLLNRVAPVIVLVSDDGRRVVTFDDWHGVGYGPNVVVIYDATGSVLGRYALSDLLPEAYIRALPHSVSSIHWRGQTRIEAERNTLVVPIVIPNTEVSGKSNYIMLEFGLAEAKPEPMTGPEWDGAMDRAGAYNAAVLAARERQIAYLRAPLVWPTENTQRAWHDYLREAFARLSPNYLQHGSTSTTVLRSPDAADYAVSEQWVVDRFADQAEFSDGAASFASLGPPDNFVRVLKKAADGVPAGSMAQTTVYVAIAASHREAAIAAIAKTGAKFVWLDPATPIPQRPERIPGSPEEAAANEARLRRMTEDAAEAASDASEAASRPQQSQPKADAYLTVPAGSTPANTIALK